MFQILGDVKNSSSAPPVFPWQNIAILCILATKPPELCIYLRASLWLSLERLPMDLAKELSLVSRAIKFAQHMALFKAQTYH